MGHGFEPFAGWATYWRYSDRHLAAVAPGVRLVDLRLEDLRRQLADRAAVQRLADWLEQECPAAANSLREGLEECFTINRLGIPPSLHRCLATTNLIESPQSGVRMRTRRVCRWRDTAMVARWAVASFLATEKNFRRIMGWKDLWQLEAILGRKTMETAALRQEVA